MNFIKKKKKISDFLLIITEAICSFITGSLISIYASWKVGLSVIIFGPLMALTAKSQELIKKGGTSKINSSYEKSSSLLTDSLTNIKTVASFAQEEKLIKLYIESLQKPKRITISQGLLTSLIYGFSQFLFLALYAYAYFIAIYFYSKNEVSYSNMLLAIYGIMFGAYGTGVAFQNMPDLGKSNSVGKHLLSILDQESHIKVKDKSCLEFVTFGTNINGHIQFKNVKFSYPNRSEYIFNNLNLEFLPSQKYAIGLLFFF